MGASIAALNKVNSNITIFYCLSFYFEGSDCIAGRVAHWTTSILLMFLSITSVYFTVNSSVELLEGALVSYGILLMVLTPAFKVIMKLLSLFALSE